MTTITENVGYVGKVLSGAAMVDFIRYALAAGVLWLFFYVIRRPHWLHRKVRAGFPRWRDIRREVGLSMLTCVIYGVVAVLSLYAIRHGWTRIYRNIHAYGWWW